MKLVLWCALGLLAANSLWADDLTQAVQQRLKDQGFYYGEVDGRGGDETSAAIRRYQIRHGLKVTGQLNDETLHALGVSSSPRTARPVPEYQEEAPGGGQPNDQYDRQPPRQYDGRSIPRLEGPENYNQMQPPSPAIPGVVTSLPRLFAGTIYEKSPTPIQENVLYAVQGELMRRGFFKGVINGRPGPATSNAIIRLQQNDGLPLTGRLDNETLNDLGAFPGQHNGPPEEGSRQPIGAALVG
jgi:peptidoglycan hydrolase-like protein with peptidoglycan-binding domain